MSALSGWTYAAHIKPKYASEFERLMVEADALDREAEMLEGTCWVGDTSPSMARKMQAAEKRRHAMLIPRELRRVRRKCRRGLII